jgi:hypothetical protein
MTELITAQVPSQGEPCGDIHTWNEGYEEEKWIIYYQRLSKKKNSLISHTEAGQNENDCVC